jgi:hypothetical protein
MTDKTKAQYLKNIRWLLVSSLGKLSENEQDKLERALEANQPLATVYYLKEKLRIRWTLLSKEEGGKWLESWID